MSSIPTKQIDGDVAVGRNVSAGGDANIQGNARIGHNLKVEGWLDARNIKGPNRGLFPTVEVLKRECPLPHAGWYALVGDTLPATVYISIDGEWVTTGKQGGNPILDTSLITIYDIGISQGYSAKDHPAKLFLYRRGQEPLSVPFPIATTEYDGFMTAAQVKELADVRSVAEGMAVNGMEYLSFEDQHISAITLSQGGEGVASVTLPHANVSRSGLMCRGQAIQLDELHNDMPGVKESVTQAHSKADRAILQAEAAAESGLQLPRFSGIVVDLPSGTAVYDSATSSPSTGAGCAVVFDKSCNRFLLRRAPEGSHPTYHTLWADAESMGLTRDPDPLLPRVFRASEGVAYMATEPPYGLYFLSEQGAVPVPGSQLLPAIEAKVDKEEGKGLSSNDFTDEEKSTLDNLRCLPCYVPFYNGTLSEEQQERNRLTFEALLSNQLNGSPACALLHIIPVDISLDAGEQARSIGTLMRLTTDLAFITCTSQDPGGVYVFMMDSDGYVYDRGHYQGVRSSAIEYGKLIVGNTYGTLESTTLKTINKKSLLGEGDISLGLSEEEQHTLDNLRCLPCYVPDTGTRLGEEQKAVNKRTFDSIKASLNDDCCYVINIINPEYTPGIPARVRSIGYVLIQDAFSALIYYAVQGSIGKYATVKLNSDGSLSDHTLSAMTVPVSRVKENHVLTGGSDGNIESTTLKTFNGQSLLGEGDIKAVKPEEGKGLTENDYTNADKSKLDALPTNEQLTQTMNEKQDAGTALRKTEQTLTDAERTQVRKNLAIGTYDATGRWVPQSFIDQWNIMGDININTTKQKYAYYDKDKALFYINDLWLSYEEAILVYQHRVLNTLDFEGKCKNIGHPYANNINLRTIASPVRIDFAENINLKAFAYNCANIETLVLSTNLVQQFEISNCTDSFVNCSKLRSIIGNARCSKAPDYPQLLPFRGCTALEAISFGFKFDISFADCPNLSLSSLTSIVSQSDNGITITVHPDAYARVTDEIFALAAAKQITIATPKST